MTSKNLSHLNPEVRSAVEDILFNRSSDSHTEWLQREYVRLMKREAATRNAYNESKIASRKSVGCRKRKLVREE